MRALDGSRVHAADALAALFVDDAEQLGLHRHGEGGDFVEHDGARAGKLEASDLGWGAGEDAVFIAEQLGFAQLRAAVRRS